MRQPRSVRPLFAQIVACIALLTSASLVTADETANQKDAVTESPIKSPNDHNSYRDIELKNGLQVLLVSDPDADKAAASMNVSVGSGDDPAGREGLAHFLEHMLFLGTEKYPEPGEYQQFIASHGGGHNAFTAFQDTNYFFDVQAKSLEPALDRFSQQFTAPLFNEKLVDQEKQTVNSEYSSKLKEDSRRFLSAEKATYNPEHPFSHFAVGSDKTLADSPDNPLRDDLVTFWKSHYSANLMSLVVYGRESLDQLEKMVRPRFSAIANRDLKASEYNEPFFKPDTLPALLRVQALKDVRELVFRFPMPSLKADYADKPAGYVANLLGHEGKGSLLSVLKEASLAESLAAGPGQDTGHETTLNVRITLTPEGLKRWKDVVALTFQTIDDIRENGIQKPYFEELQKLSQMKFRFREASEPIGIVSQLAMQMDVVKPEDVLRAPYMAESYTPEKYRDVLSNMTRDNVLIGLLSPQEIEGKTQTTTHYDTPYQLTPLAEIKGIEKAQQSLSKQLVLPEPNPFVPENFDMVSGKTMSHPVKLDVPSAPTLWYAKNKQFDTPKANVFISLRSPLTHDNPRGKVLTSLLAKTLRDDLNAYTYPAKLAGLDYAIYTHLRGITIRVGGYDDKLHVLLRRILSQVASPDINEQRFDVAREQFMDKLRNQSKQKPVTQATTDLQQQLIQGVWSAQDKLDVLEDLTVDDLREFADRFDDELDPVMLVHGNMTEAAAINMQRQVSAILLDSSKIVKVPRSGVRAVPEGEGRITLTVDHPDTGYALYIQGDSTKYDERARYTLLAQIISAPFYESLRTQQQLGYIVSAAPFEMLEVPALGFIVQSPSADAATIDAATGEFLKSFGETLAGFSKKELAQQKQAVVSKLLAKDRQLGQITQRYWQEIDAGNTDFDTREKLADAVKDVSLSSLMSLYHDNILPRAHALIVDTAQPVKDEEKGGKDETKNGEDVIPALRSAPFVY